MGIAVSHFDDDDVMGWVVGDSLGRSLPVGCLVFVAVVLTIAWLAVQLGGRG